jgi:hypothetical protein
MHDGVKRSYINVHGKDESKNPSFLTHTRHVIDPKIINVRRVIYEREGESGHKKIKRSNLTGVQHVAFNMNPKS